MSLHRPQSATTTCSFNNKPERRQALAAWTYTAIHEFWQELTAFAILLADLPTSEVARYDICVIGSWWHSTDSEPCGQAAPVLTAGGRWRRLRLTEFLETPATALLKLELLIGQARCERVTGAIPRKPIEHQRRVIGPLPYCCGLNDVVALPPWHLAVPGGEHHGNPAHYQSGPNNQ